MNLLLTGATGFVGRNLLLSAIREGRYRKIWVPVRSTEKLRVQFQGDGFEGIPSSVVPIVSSAQDWKLGEAGQADHVVHSAGVIFARTREEYYNTNVKGTLSLLEALKPNSRLVILSSQSAAGPCPQGVSFRRETDVESPLTWYGQSKLEMERKVRQLYPYLNALFLRPPMIFGARDQATLPLFKMMKRPLHFKPGLRAKHYSFIDVSDLVRAIFAALDAPDWEGLPQRHFFVAAERPISDRELLETAAQASGCTARILPVPQPLLKGVSRVVDAIPTWRATIPSLSVDRAKEIWPDRWVISPQAFEACFQWKATRSLPVTLKETRDWYVKTGQL